MSKEIKQTKAFYNAHANDWIKRHTNSFHHEKQFIQFIKLLPKTASVLDIGCANGIHVPLYLGIGKTLRYTGLDISTSLLKIARRRYPHLSFIEGDVAESKMLPRKKFDGFFAAAILMHIPFEQWNTMFRNIERITKPKGVGYLVIPVERPDPGNELDVRHFTLLDVTSQEKFLKKMNWKILKKGVSDGTNESDTWRWYIVKLP